MPGATRKGFRRTGDSDKAPASAPPNAQSPWVLLRSATNHPFIYQRMVRSADPAAKPGDVVQVYDKYGQLLGRGFYNPRSQISVRMLALGDVPVDDAFWQTKIEGAVALRRQLGLDRITDAYRIVHAEGDGLTGLIAERYADCIVLEIFSIGIYERRTKILEALGKAMGAPASLDRPTGIGETWRTFVRADSAIESLEGFHVRPKDNETKGTVNIREHGIRYRVDPAGGHKTGFFCDQRDNRRRFAELCQDANVLDLCCYTGGFGLCAKQLGKAKDVTSVDLDEEALAIARDNVNLNSARVSLVHADVFAYLRQMLANGRKFDAVVADPPKLASSRLQVEEALRKYHDLNNLAMQVVRPGGLLLTCSCSGLVSRETFLQTIQYASRSARRTIQVLDQTGAAMDHPMLLNCPESAYLKAIWLRVI